MTRENLTGNEISIKVLGLIGFGEAARAFSQGWQNDLPDISIAAFDINVFRSILTDRLAPDYLGDLRVTGELLLGAVGRVGGRAGVVAGRVERAVDFD